jgi:hypothetical protein
MKIIAHLVIIVMFTLVLGVKLCLLSARDSTESTKSQELYLV